jgi:HlyD family secretion protein
MKYVKLFLIVLSGLILSGCGENNDGNITGSGTIETTNIVVSSKVNGTVKKIVKDEGDAVKLGDTVLIIDSEVYELQLEQANAIQSAAEARYRLITEGARKEDKALAKEKLNQAQTNFNLAKIKKERIENLYKSNSISQQKYDDVIAKYKLAQAQLNSAKQHYLKIKNGARPEEIQQAKANLEKANANLNLIKKQIRDCYVTSPQNGVIVKKFVEIGENVPPFGALFKVSDLSTVKLVIYVSEQELGKVKLGQTVEVKTDTYPDKIYKGKVTYISPEAEFTPKSVQTKDERTKLVFAVKIEIPNENSELKAGMPADAVIKLERFE